MRKDNDKFNAEDWNPKTSLGKKVKSGEISNIDRILNEGYPILEPEIVDFLFPGIAVDYLNLGQRKGKFGGGQRSPIRQTQKITEDGSTVKFTSLATVGNSNGIVGVGLGASSDSLPSKNKALRNAKLNLIKIRRGCGSWDCGCATPHSIPFKVTGKCGSVEVELLPAPKGTGLKINKEIAKILRLAGIKDIWSRTVGHTEVKLNHVFAVFDALKKLSILKLLPSHYESLGIAEGSSQDSGIETIQDIVDEDDDIVVDLEDQDIDDSEDESEEVEDDEKSSDNSKEEGDKEQ